MRSGCEEPGTICGRIFGRSHSAQSNPCCFREMRYSIDCYRSVDEKEACVENPTDLLRKILPEAPSVDAVVPRGTSRPRLAPAMVVIQEPQRECDASSRFWQDSREPRCCSAPSLVLARALFCLPPVASGFSPPVTRQETWMAGASPINPSWTEVATYIGFAPWFAYGCLYFGLGLFVLSLALGIASTPRWLNRLIGGIIAAIAAMLAVAAAGWYLALGRHRSLFCRRPGAVVWLSYFSAVRSAKSPAGAYVDSHRYRGLRLSVVPWVDFLTPAPQKARARGPLQPHPGNAESPVKEPWFESKDVAAEVSALHIAVEKPTAGVVGVPLRPRGTRDRRGT